MAVAEQHERRKFVTVANVKAVATTLEEYSGTASNNASIAELELLIVSHCVCQVDQFLILDRLEGGSDNADDLTAVTANIGYMSLDSFTSVQSQRDSIDTPAQISLDFTAVDVSIRRGGHSGHFC